MKRAITNQIQHLEKIAKDKKLNVIIFTFRYQNVNYKCFYILHGEAIVVAPEGYNIGLDISIKDRQLNNFLPEEIYLKLREIHQEQLKTKEFCNIMLDAITNLTADMVLKNNNDFYKVCRSKSNSYSEDDKTQFYCWSRSHCRRKATKSNLKKTRVFFGEELYLICKLNNISSRWKSKPKGIK